MFIYDTACDPTLVNNIQEHVHYRAIYYNVHLPRTMWLHDTVCITHRWYATQRGKLKLIYGRFCTGLTLRAILLSAFHITFTVCMPNRVRYIGPVSVTINHNCLYTADRVYATVYTFD